MTSGKRQRREHAPLVKEMADLRASRVDEVATTVFSSYGTPFDRYPPGTRGYDQWRYPRGAPRRAAERREYVLRITR